MSVVVQRESTEYLYVGVTGDVPTVGVEVALMGAGDRPESGDWETAVLVDDAGDPLWDDATASGVTGNYFAALLVGSFGGNPVTPVPGDYQVWLRVTDTTERPVRIAPIALEIA